MENLSNAMSRKKTFEEIRKQDQEMEKLIQEMNEPKVTAQKLGLSVSHTHYHYRLRGMRRGYITDKERLQIIAARKGVAL